MNLYFEAVVAGAGCSGLAMACELDEKLDPAAQILVVDPELDTIPNKTWSYWGFVAGPHQKAIVKTWHKMEVAFPAWTKRQVISECPYTTVDAGLYHQQLLEKLKASSRVTLLKQAVNTLENTESGVRLCTDQESYFGRWAFQSYDSGTARAAHYPLRQHFGGWVVRTKEPCFDPTSITLMDFRVPQVGELRFFYSLPFDECHALVEATVFSEQVAERESYDLMVSDYLNEKVSGAYCVERCEYGVIPMEERFYQPQTGSHIFNIGAVGGMTKPTTGYTFARTMRQVQHLCSSLVAGGRPQPLPASELRHQLADLLFLDVLKRQGGKGFEVFEELFARNSFEEVLAFLDEKTTWQQELHLLIGLKWSPFLRALWSTAHLWSPKARSAA